MNFKIEELVLSFSKIVASGKIEIYNEFSLQHELGIYLRPFFPTKKVQFERNVAQFGLEKSNFKKKEMDIVIFNEPDSPDKIAIELKFPRNGQVPEQMFSFCKDINFTEQLVRAGFKYAFVVIFIDNHLYWEGEKQDGIYSYFRNEQLLTGLVQKPTGSITDDVFIKGAYTIKWKQLTNSMKFTVIKAQNIMEDDKQ